LRLVCTSCGRVHYENPKIVCGVVAISEDKERVLLARRNIEPRKGYWGIPAGFLELGESCEAGAEREAYEETYAKLGPLVLVGVYSILGAKQIQLVYKCTLRNEHELKNGVETQETQMFPWNSIPWNELAFATNSWALKYVFNTLHTPYPNPQHRTKKYDGSYVDTPVALS